jgi:uncharacterized protein YcfJ
MKAAQGVRRSGAGMQEATQMIGRMLVAAAATALLAGCASQGGYYHSAPADRAYREPHVRDYRVRDVERRDYGYREAVPDRTHSSAPTAGQRGNVVPAQVAGAVAGGLLGAQVGSGSGRLAAAAVGAAAGAYGVGRMADPCQPDLNAGHAVGGVAGGLLGSMVGSGRGRSLATALGAAAGAITGGNLASQPGCR